MFSNSDEYGATGYEFLMHGAPLRFYLQQELAEDDINLIQNA